MPPLLIQLNKNPLRRSPHTSRRRGIIDYRLTSKRGVRIADIALIARHRRQSEKRDLFFGLMEDGKGR
jgi:hypothetical protein